MSVITLNGYLSEGWPHPTLPCMASHIFVSDTSKPQRRCELSVKSTMTNSTRRLMGPLSEPDWAPGFSALCTTNPWDNPRLRDHSNQSELLTSVDSACISKRSGQEIRGFKNKRFQPSQPSRNGRKEITKNQYFSIGRLHRTSVKSTNRSKGYGGTCQVSNDIMTEVDIPQGLEILYCNHAVIRRVHTTIYSTE